MVVFTYWAEFVWICVNFIYCMLVPVQGMYAENLNDVPEHLPTAVCHSFCISNTVVLSSFDFIHCLHYANYLSYCKTRMTKIYNIYIFTVIL